MSGPSRAAGTSAPGLLPAAPISNEPATAAASHAATESEPGDHSGHGDHLSHAQHAVHQSKLGVHSAEHAAHVVHGVAARARTTRAIGEGGRHLKQLLPAADKVAAHQLAPLTDAARTLEGYAAAQARALQASRQQSQLARQLNNLLTQGAQAGEIQAFRQQLDQAARVAHRAHESLARVRPQARAARALVREVAAATHNSAPSSGYLARGLRAVAKTQSGQRALKLAHTAAESRLGTAIATMSQSKVVRVGGKVLIVAAVAVDGIVATREDATVAGNAFRFAGQAGASTVLYTQAPLLPVLLAEAFVFDKPHITGPVQAATQMLGVGVDYAAGGAQVGERALANLDGEMKAGRYGAVIKGANYFGQSLADHGSAGVYHNTLDYWSSHSPSQVWRDTKDIWSWLAE